MLDAMRKDTDGQLTGAKERYEALRRSTEEFKARTERQREELQELRAELDAKQKLCEQLSALVDTHEDKENDDSAMREDLATLLKYKNDLELILEKSTSTLELKNRKL